MKPTTRSFAGVLAIVVGLTAAGRLEAAPNATVEGVSDSALRSELELAIGDAKSPPRSVPEARRRAIAAARDALALLRSEGYYDSVDEPDVSPSPAARPVVRITLGARFKLKTASIDWVGGAPDPAARDGAVGAIGLVDGAPGRAADILAAEGRAIAVLEKLGYADAAILPREVVVDHADFTLKPTFRVAAGAKVRLGAVRLKGGGRTRSRWVAQLATWTPGATYDPALLATLEKRLLDTGAFESATVDLGPKAAGAPREVVVTLVDRKPHSVELGAGYSTTEGSGLDAKWTRYNRLGRADSLILTAKLYDIQQKLDLEEDLPDWWGVDRTLKIGGGFLGDRTAAYDDIGGGVRLDVVRRYSKSTSFTLGGAFDFASTREKTAINPQATPVGQTLDLYITTAQAALVLDRSNSLLDPTKGWRLAVEADPTWIAGDRELVYFKSQAQLSGSWPLGAGLPDLAARVKLGSILGGSIPGVPADRRFYAGGGGSVRGYAYQGVGPRLSDNTPEGGLSVTEGSFEIRQSLGRRWGVVAFADAGGVGATAAPRFDNLAIGVGAGIRYDLGFGPLRLDLGTPLNPRPGDSPIQVYISIGQAF